MNKLTKILLKKFIKDSKNTEEQNIRVKYGFLEAWISIIGNIVIFGFKIFGFILKAFRLLLILFLLFPME